MDFYRGWEEYKWGFGNKESEFWLGNEHIYALTNQGEKKSFAHVCLLVFVRMCVCARVCAQFVPRRA